MSSLFASVPRRVLAFRIAGALIVCLLIAGPLFIKSKLPPAEEKSFTLVLEHGQLVSGPALIGVNQGDRLTLHIKSDQGAHFMIHGYEQDLIVGAGSEAALSFVADKSGRFFLHLHKGDDHVEIATLEVQPR